MVSNYLIILLNKLLRELGVCLLYENVYNASASKQFFPVCLYCWVSEVEPVPGQSTIELSALLRAVGACPCGL